MLVCATLAGCTSSPPSSTKPPAPTVSGLVWTTLAQAPTPRTEVAAALADGRIYVIGGYTADGATVATVEVLDVASGRWEGGPDLPVAVNHAMASTVDDTVYVFGGYLAGNVPTTTAFRLEGDRWRAVTPLPEGRAAGTAVAIDRVVYVAGGIAPGGGLAGAMLHFDTASNEWRTVPGPPTPREHLGGGSLRRPCLYRWRPYRRTVGQPQRV